MRLLGLGPDVLDLSEPLQPLHHSQQDCVLLLGPQRLRPRHHLADTFGHLADSLGRREAFARQGLTDAPVEQVALAIQVLNKLDEVVGLHVVRLRQIEVLQPAPHGCDTHRSVVEQREGATVPVHDLLLHFFRRQFAVFEDGKGLVEEELVVLQVVVSAPGHVRLNSVGGLLDGFNQRVEKVFLAVADLSVVPQVPQRHLVHVELLHTAVDALELVHVALAHILGATVHLAPELVQEGCTFPLVEPCVDLAEALQAFLDLLWLLAQQARAENVPLDVLHLGLKLGQLRAVHGAPDGLGYREDLEPLK
mmetsp:Transcript_60863/g.162847  ORF Transcript_60863/g.162847 Transcript_60863/m.162847 type:complete len:307 (-) Transcript_60863:2233-3153(-)